jgi:hypothetical protein
VGGGSEQALLHDLAHDVAPRLLPYAMSFLTLGIFWVGQQTQLSSFARSTRALTASREETAEFLDGALRLIDEAQALAHTRRSASAATEQYIQHGWEPELRATRRRIDRRPEALPRKRFAQFRDSPKIEHEQSPPHRPEFSFVASAATSTPLLLSEPAGS